MYQAKSVVVPKQGLDVPARTAPRRIPLGAQQPSTSLLSTDPAQLLHARSAAAVPAGSHRQS